MNKHLSPFHYGDLWGFWLLNIETVTLIEHIKLIFSKEYELNTSHLYVYSLYIYH